MFLKLSPLKSKDKKELNKRLQQMESRVIIDTITKRISMESPDMFITTIHDGIMCKKTDAKYVESITMAEFNKLGLTPTIKIK